MKENIYNYKRHDLYVDTNIQNTIIPFINDKINVNNNENIARDRKNNNYTFKDFISSIMKKHTMTSKEIKIKMIALTIAFSMPQLFFDWWNIHDININNLSDTYLLIAIVQKQTFSFIFCYYIVGEDLHNIYQFSNGNKHMSMLCKIDTYWCEYYSILGIIIVIYNWFISRYIDQTNIYILVFSILKLLFIKNITKIK
jgi:hypothetical protein